MQICDHYVVHDLLEWVLTTKLIYRLIITHRPVNRPAIVNKSPKNLLSRAQSLMCRETLILASADTLCWMTDCTALVRLNALVAIKSSALELACFFFDWATTIFETALSTAIASIPVTLSFVVFTVACAISDPDHDTSCLGRLNRLQNHDFFSYSAGIVAVVYNTRLWKFLVRKNFSAGPPRHSKTKRVDKKSQ